MLTDIDILALIIGSLFHDYGHPVVLIIVVDMIMQMMSEVWCYRV